MSKGERVTAAGAVIYIGEFQLQLDLNLLHKDGSPMPLGDRAINVLKALARRPHQTVPRAVLMQEAWVDRTGHRLVVEPGNLQVQIFNLRRVLGKNAIQTVLDCGYALVLPVHTFDEHALMLDFPHARELPRRPIACLG
jgi:DNA-binding winged helix-turn-helix (wHTH) protein